MVRQPHRLSGRQNAQGHLAPDRRKAHRRENREQRAENGAERGQERVLDDGLPGHRQHSDSVYAQQIMVRSPHVQPSREDRARHLRRGHSRNGGVHDEVYETD